MRTISEVQKHELQHYVLHHSHHDRAAATALPRAANEIAEWNEFSSVGTLCVVPTYGAIMATFNTVIPSPSICHSERSRGICFEPDVMQKQISRLRLT
jgi:hypothetical protein